MVKYIAEDMFAALGQPVRRSMIEHLAERGTMSITEMAEPFSISLPAALKHTEVLEENGLIIRNKRGRVQYCTINNQAFEEMLSWLLFQKKFWESSFVRLERHINNHKNK